MNEKGYYYPAKSLRLANYLANNGFKISKVLDSDDDPRRKTFFFIRTPELEELVKKFMTEEVGEKK